MASDAKRAESEEGVAGLEAWVVGKWVEPVGPNQMKELMGLEVWLEGK